MVPSTGASFSSSAGAVPLAVRGGYITAEQVGQLWTLWPLVVVGIGVGLILRRTQFDFLGGLLIAATFGLMIGGLVGGGVGGFPGQACGSDSGGVAFPSRDGSIAQGPATVDLRIDCGNLTLGVVPGTAWSIAGKDSTGDGPTVTSSANSLLVKSNNRRDGFGPFTSRQSWNVTLPDAPNLDLSIHVNAGSATGNLGNATLGETNVESNAGSTSLDLGSVRAIKRLNATLNAGSLAHPAEPVLRRVHRGKRRLRQGVRTGRRRPPPPHRRKQPRKLRLHGAGTRRGRCDVDDARVRNGRGEDRPADAGKRWFLRPEPGGWL